MEAFSDQVGDPRADPEHSDYMSKMAWKHPGIPEKALQDRDACASLVKPVTRTDESSESGRI